MSSVFGKLKTASSTQGRNPFISKTGVSIDHVLRVRAGFNREKVPFFAVDLEIVEVLSETPLAPSVLAYNEKTADKAKHVPEGAHQPGEKVTEYTKIAPPQLDSKLGNVKNFIDAVCDALEIDNSEWTDDQWEAVSLGVPEDEKGDKASVKEERAEMRAWLEENIGDAGGIGGGDGTLLAGTALIRSSEARIGVKSGTPYIVSTFQPAPEGDDEEE